MSRQSSRKRNVYDRVWNSRHLNNNKGEGDTNSYKNTVVGKQFTVSEGHPINRRTGVRMGGGPFFTSRVTQIIDRGYVTDAYIPSKGQYYTGPVSGAGPSSEEMSKLGYKNASEAFGDKNESQMLADGTTAIALSNPINPAAKLGTTLAETFREGIPSLPGIQSWQAKTKFLKGLGSEYLNYQFGWAPLLDEVSNVRDAARHHRDVLAAYHNGEGRNTHRSFEFPLQREATSTPDELFQSLSVPGIGIVADGTSRRQVFLVRETRKWFEGCFTYALPSSTDSWRKALGFGSDADKLFGISLNPEILWELTPWSWAVDWFSNTGFVISNVTNFGLAGLVMRYGYIMEESIERIYAEGNGANFLVSSKKESPTMPSGTWRRGVETVTKRRVPASPFGFSIGWQDLSPTQLAITAALGITRLL